MASRRKYDCIIIGAGQGGALARMLAEAGQRVALVERHHIGGTCINYGCTPTKVRISAAKLAADARKAHRFGVHVAEVQVNLAELVQHSDEVVHSFRDFTAKKLAAVQGLDIICGEAQFTGPQCIQVKTSTNSSTELSAKSIVIATGAEAKLPEIEGLHTVDFLDYKGVLELTEIPDHLVILGGGYIACEYSQMFARLGARVTLLQSGPQLLEQEDQDVAQGIREVLEADSVEVKLNAEATRVEPTASGIRLHLKEGPRLEGSHIMVAVGQQPNTACLNLEAAGVKTTEAGHVVPDDYLEAADGIYALGDVKGGPAFTHISFDDARILYNRLVGGEKVSIRNRPIPYVVFTDPQLGRIGLSEKAAREAGLKFRVGKIAVTDTARGIETGQEYGFLKALVEDETDQILGGAMLTAEGGEIMAVLQMAMQAKLPYTTLRDAIFAHPTMTEAFNNLFLAMDRESSGREKETCIRTSNR